ncbi:hypothetical protein [Streptomyces cylindrosporus]|uniref:Uncharacterized protein n=1 Tax=Streptomyces cylindrosporus TaxID=2927583 RepID=A0ABS9Y7Y3_9ACTN|nr:hypothetical protein [Streptomyces cylindrosporus]MCI3273339.1 hypothetical protein [Streptomyces cylindrosporus]
MTRSPAPRWGKRTSGDALLALGKDRPLPVVIDEFPSSSIPSTSGRLDRGMVIDVVVRGAAGQDNGVLLSLGEAKWDQAMGVAHLD